MEVQLAAQFSEKRILRTQTLLCDMLLRDSPPAIITQSPSVMDLIKCNGAALYHRERYWPLGACPSESQIKDIVQWLRDSHADSTGLSTDSLADAGFPGAAALGDAVCGMAAARINRKDFLFWFRSHTAKEIKWGGAKHHPQDRDDGQRMQPRSSFQAFLEVVKSRSLPWENSELDAIHSLQLILRDSFKDEFDEAGTSDSMPLVNVEKPQEQQQQQQQQHGEIEQLSSVAREMVRLIETATVPIFAVDSDGRINGWNPKVADLTGLPVEEAMGKSLVEDLAFQGSIDVLDRLLFRALRGNLVALLHTYLKIKFYCSEMKV